MYTKYDFEGATEARIVYVRSVDVADLPEEVQEQARAEGTKQLYAVCSPEGEQLALVADRELAFVLARQNDFSPVTVH